MEVGRSGVVPVEKEKKKARKNHVCAQCLVVRDVAFPPGNLPDRIPVIHPTTPYLTLLLGVDKKESKQHGGESDDDTVPQ